MRKAKTSNTPRKLEESSWLAQIIKDKMDAESAKMGLYPSIRWSCLNTLYIIVKEADNLDNHNIYYDNYNGKRQIIICDIPSMAIEYGTDFDRNGMQCRLRDLQARYTDDGLRAQAETLPSINRGGHGNPSA